MEIPVPKPHLPSGEVRSILYGARYRKRLQPRLDALGIESITLEDCPFVAEPVRGHIDLSCCHTAEGEIVLSESASEALKSALSDRKYSIYTGNDVVFPKYPHEIAYNAAVVGASIFCNPQYMAPEVLDRAINLKLELIACSQGYAKCSIAVIDAHSIITSDKDICQKATKAGYEALLIEPGYIELQGYSYGLIGGCAAKLGPNLIAFTGSFAHHPDAVQIRRFITERGIDIAYLTEHTVFDVGSMIPLTQEKSL